MCCLQFVYEDQCRGSKYRKHSKLVNYNMIAVVAHRNTGPCINNLGDFNALTPGLTLDYKCNANIFAPVNPPRGNEAVANPAGGRMRKEQKSVVMLGELVRRYSNVGDLVVDLYGGTFSTALACFQAGRRAVCFEQDLMCGAVSANHVWGKVSGSDNAGVDVGLIELLPEKVASIVARADGMEDTIEYAKACTTFIIVRRALFSSH